jgi:hypothetical protein
VVAPHYINQGQHRTPPPRRNNAATMGDSESSLFSFFFYVLFVYPATNWLLKPGRFSRTKGLTYAISLLVAIAAVKTGLELKEQGPNYYQLMKVGRSATALEIKRSYKKMSLELHPDKNPSATALDDFATLKNAYDVLMDMDAREVYDRFGPEKLKQKVAVIDEYKVLVEVAIFYAAWGIMTWMLTLGKHNSNARQWVFTGSMQCLWRRRRGGGRVDGVGAWLRAQSMPSPRRRVDCVDAGGRDRIAPSPRRRRGAGRDQSAPSPGDITPRKTRRHDRDAGGRGHDAPQGDRAAGLVPAGDDGPRADTARAQPVSRVPERLSVHRRVLVRGFGRPPARAVRSFT